MARKITVMLTCDLDDEDVPATDTVHFSYNGTSYAFELCERHLEEFTKTMEHYVSTARKEETRGRGRRLAASAPARPTRAAKASVGSADIRAWAREKGFEVSDRGRIPTPILHAWEASQAE